MELKGLFSEQIISDMETLSLKGARELFFENTGSVAVHVGLRELVPGKSFQIASSVTFTENSELKVVFKNETGKKALYFSKTIVTDRCNCS